MCSYCNWTQSVFHSKAICPAEVHLSWKEGLPAQREVFQGEHPLNALCTLQVFCPSSWEQRMAWPDPLQVPPCDAFGFVPSVSSASLLSFSGFHSLELLDFWRLHAWRCWLTAKVRIGSRCCVDAKQHNSISKFLNLSCSQWSSMNLLQIHWLGVDEFQKPVLPCSEKSKASHVKCP